MKLLNREHKPQSSLTPIEEHPDYQSRQLVVDRLKSELNTLSKEQTDIINRANKFRRSSVEVLSAAYLTDAHPPLDEEAANRKRLGELSFRSQAVRLAIQRAENDVKEIRYRLSDVTAEEQAPQYRTFVRRALSAMLALQQANADIVSLRENREALGYSGIFNPVGLSPWPFWGDPKEASSNWQQILKEFLEQGHISPGEHHRIIAGVREEIEP